MNDFIMKKKFTFFFILFFGFFATSSFATEYLRFDCPIDTMDYKACNQMCTHDKKLRMSAKIRVNVGKDIVMVNHFILGTPIDSTVYKKCEVIDEKNWICLSDNEVANWTMVDGLINFSSSEYDGVKGCYKVAN